jgi:hypothetical protein
MQAGEILLQRPSSIGLEEARAQGRMRSIRCAQSAKLNTALWRLTSRIAVEPFWTWRRLMPELSHPMFSIMRPVRGCSARLLSVTLTGRTSKQY